jgi:DNA-binding NarL/FixJ family response regulator
MRQQVEGFAFSDLSEQEIRILARIAQGQTNREIGEALYLSEKTVRNYVSGILGKLGLTSRVQAAAYAARNNIERYVGSEG